MVQPSRAQSGPLKAVLYFRVSTEKQAASGLGLEDQKRACEAYAAQRGYEVVGRYEDPGISGKDTVEKRAGLQAVIAAAGGREDVVVVVHSLSRLSRRQSLTWALLDDRGAYRLQVASVKEAFDTTTAMGKAMLGMLATFNALEADLCSERTSAALQARRARGHRLGARPLVAEAPDVVREVQALYDSGRYTHRSLAAELNARGIRTKRGKKWYPTQVARTLRQQVPS